MAEELRILILEDNPADAELIQFELEEAGFIFTAKVAATENDFIHELQTFSPGLILSDYDLPRYNGALALVEARKRIPDTPFILVTGAVGEDRAIEILTMGAKDYILKNRLQQRLAPAVRRALAEAEEYRARKQAEDELRETQRTLEEIIRIRTAELEAEVAVRKRMEAALRKSGQRFRNLLQNIPNIAVHGYGQDGTIQYWNQASEHLYGYSASEAVGRNLTDILIPPEMKKEVQQAIRQMAETGQPIPAAERSLTRKDGSRISVYSSHAVIRIPGRATELFRIDIDLTRRKATEEARQKDLREREKAENARQIIFQRLNTMVSNMHSSVLLVGENKIELANQAFCNYFGVQASPEDLVGLPMDKLMETVKKTYLHPEKEVARIREIIAREQPVTGEEVALQGGRTCLRDYIPVFLDGKLNSHLWHHIDITERKNIENKLRQSEERQRLLAETMLQGVMHMDAAGEIIEMNPAAERILGRNREQFRDSRSVRDERDCVRENGEIFPDIEHPSMLALKTGQPVHDVTMRVYNPKLGDYRWISIDAVPVFIPGETSPAEVYAVFEDITERRRREEALRKNEGRFRALSENIPDMIVRFDRNLKFLYANPAALRRIGLPVEALIGRTAGAHAAAPSDASNWIKLAREVLDSGETRRCEHISRWQGETRIFDVQLVPERDNGGVVQAIIAIGHDITESKYVEDQLVKQTVQLQERKVQLENANQELESFGYSISHDLKAPLRAIDGYSRMLMKKYGSIFTDDAMHMFNVICSNTGRMTALIDDLLSFSRALRSGITASEIDMDKIAEEVCKEIETLYAERELEFRITKLLPGYGDGTLIRQVLLNLFSNAAKFTKNRKPGIIEMSSWSEDGETAYCLKDNGAGFDMAYYDKLFAVFQRLHSLEEYEGTGLGLAIVQRIVQRHGGRIWAKGEVDKGASFYFTLPQSQDRLISGKK